MVGTPGGPVAATGSGMPPAAEGNGAGSLPGVPELPEVESVRRQLVPRLSGRRILEVWWDPHPQARFHAVDRLRNRRIEGVERRGKFLICPLDTAPEGGGDQLVLHLGMTGSLSVEPTSQAGADPDGGLTHVRARLALDDGHTVRFRDPRRFGRLSVVAPDAYAEVVPTLAVLGPEPLSPGFTVEHLAEGLARSRAPVKARLLDQRLVAGVGNIYADEALWQARIHPASRRVARPRAARLHAAIVEILTAAIEREGTTFRDYQMVNGSSGRYATFLAAYGQHGRPCRRCATTLRRTVVAQRGTTYCPRCQRI